MSNKMNTNINFSLERVEGKRLIISGFFTEFSFDGFLEIPKHNINRFVLQESGILLGGSFTKLDDCPTCVVEKVWE